MWEGWRQGVGVGVWRGIREGIGWPGLEVRSFFFVLYDWMFCCI